jgi:predicted dehydrogenase
MKVGVIGLGSIGSRHANNLKILGHEVIPYDIKQPIEWPDSPQSLLDDAIKADAVVIASPTPLHWDHMRVVSNAGKPFFVEKPIADQPMGGGFGALMVGYNLRFHSCVIKAKGWIDAGHLGRPLWGNFVVAQYSDKPDYLRDGVILNWSHEIDLALYLLGPAYVKACATYSDEDIADIILRHTNGSQSTVHLDYLTKPEIRQTIIVGSESTIIIDLVRRNAWLRSSEDVMLDMFQGSDTWNDNYLDEMETFIARVEGKETIGCTGQEGLEVLRICLQAKKLSQSP